jgi:hypothetical protein
MVFVEMTGLGGVGMRGPQTTQKAKEKAKQRTIRHVEVFKGCIFVGWARVSLRRNDVGPQQKRRKAQVNWREKQKYFCGFR